MQDNQLTPIDLDLLSSVTGGKAKTAAPKPEPDAADEYVGKLKKDAADVDRRVRGYRDNVRSGKWGEAAKEAGAATVNTLKLIKDAADPFQLF